MRTQQTNTIKISRANFIDSNNQTDRKKDMKTEAMEKLEQKISNLTLSTCQNWLKAIDQIQLGLNNEKSHEMETTVDQDTCSLISTICTHDGSNSKINYFGEIRYTLTAKALRTKIKKCATQHIEDIAKRATSTESKKLLTAIEDIQKILNCGKPPELSKFPSLDEDTFRAICIVCTHRRRMIYNYLGKTNFTATAQELMPKITSMANEHTSPPREQPPHIKEAKNKLTGIKMSKISLPFDISYFISNNKHSYRFNLFVENAPSPPLNTRTDLRLRHNKSYKFLIFTPENKKIQLGGIGLEYTTSKDKIEEIQQNLATLFPLLDDNADINPSIVSKNINKVIYTLMALHQFKDSFKDTTDFEFANIYRATLHQNIGKIYRLIAKMLMLHDEYAHSRFKNLAILEFLKASECYYDLANSLQEEKKPAEAKTAFKEGLSLHNDSLNLTNEDNDNTYSIVSDALNDLNIKMSRYSLYKEVTGSGSRSSSQEYNPQGSSSINNNNDVTGDLIRCLKNHWILSTPSPSNTESPNRHRNDIFSGENYYLG